MNLACTFRLTMEMNANLQTYKSMFVLVRFDCGQYHGALYKVNLEHGESGEASGDAGAESPPHVLVPVMKFFDKPLNPPKNCLFEGVRVSSKLYLMAKENTLIMANPSQPPVPLFLTQTQTQPQSRTYLHPNH